MARKGGARRMRLNTVEIAVPIQDNSNWADQPNPPLEAIPEPYLMRDTEDRVFQGILDLILTASPDSNPACF